MNNKLSWLRQKPTRRSPRLAALFLSIGALILGSGSYAAAPEWLREAARTTLPDYSEDTSAVMLLNEQVTTVSGSGEIKTRYRRAYKVLQPEGRAFATVIVDFDNETRLTSLKAWSLPVTGEPYELRQKDVVETGLFQGILYQDTRRKVFRIPGADPGGVIGYEYEQRGRPFILQDSWLVAREIPVRRARYSLRLPGGWEADPHWVNHPEVAARLADKNRSLWELENIAAIETEPAMPHWRTVASRLLVGFYPRREDLRDRAHRSWNDVGRWYGDLTRGRRTATPGIQEKVAELTQAGPTPLEKIKALAVFAQRDIRYVGHRGRYRGLPAPSGPGGLRQAIWRLQGQGNPARRDAAGGRRQVSLRVGSQPPGRGDPRSSFGFEFQPCDRGCRVALGGPLGRTLRDARSRAIGPPSFLRPDGLHDSARLPSGRSAGRAWPACRR